MIIQFHKWVNNKINMKKIICVLVLALVVSIDPSAQWAVDNFEQYLVNGNTNEYITNSKNELAQLSGSDRKDVLLTVALYEMLTRKLNNQLDLEDFYYAINLLDLEYTQTRYDFDHEFIVGLIIVNERRYYILINESEENLLNLEFKAKTEDGHSYKSINCGAWNYCAKIFDTADNSFFFYDIISYNHSNRGLSYRPCLLRKW